MKSIILAGAALAIFANSADTARAGQYAIVRGWEISQTDIGCFAAHPSRNDIQWSILVSPAGGWELRIDDLAGHPDDMEFPARVVIGDAVFTDTYFSYSGAYIGVLPLSQRLALARANQVTFNFNNMELVFSLSGSTAAMLKAEECWHQMTGFDPNVSSRRGSYAFR